MQSTATANLFHGKGVNEHSSSNASPKNLEARFIILPREKFEQIIDFLEDKWETRVSRRKNAFFLEDKLDPIAWLNSQDSITLVLVDKTSSRKNAFQVRIDDIQLPALIRIEHRIYRSLLFELVRNCGGGMVRWFNKFYQSATGKVIAELVSQKTIRIFESDGLFRTSRLVDLESYSATPVPKQLYFHLLDFLSQESGDEVVRMGNSFFPRKEYEFVNSIANSTATVSKSTMKELDGRTLAALVSSDTIRFRDGTTKKISDLVLTKKVYRNYIYYCSCCQSFVRTSHRTASHQSESGNHAITYVSSSIDLVSISKGRARKKDIKKFPAVLYKFWGIENGRVQRETQARTRRPVMEKIPISGNTKLVKPRAGPTVVLLLSADITVDGHRVTNEERLVAYERLEGEELMGNATSSKIVCEQSAGNIGKEVEVKEDPNPNLCKQQRSQKMDELPELMTDA